jgi:hypothetical protein
MIEEREPGRKREPLRFEARLGGADRTPVVMVSLVVAFVLLAIAKPWVTDAPPGVGSAGPTSRPVAVAPVVPPASPRPSASRMPTASDGSAAVAELCLEPGSWRTATIETWRDRTVRVWRAVDPGPASGPRDPAIPIVPAVGTSVPAIGFCAPGAGVDQPVGPAAVAAWRLDGSRAVPIRLRQISPVGLVSPFGALYGPQDGEAGAATWTDGVVIFRHTERGSGVERWFGIEIRGVSEPEASGGPATAVAPLP